MNKKFTPVRYFYLAMAALLFASLAFSTTAPSPTSAIDLTDENAMKRADMMAIAERYMNYQWTAVNDHWKEMDNGTEPPHYHNDKHSDNVDTPDINWCNDSWGCWDVAPAVNVGIPYFWGGSTAVEDYPDDGIPDLNLDPQDHWGSLGYFGEKLAAGLPAGDVGTNDPPAWGIANGVDCVGFIGQVWRQGVRYGMSSTKGASRPIKFKDLRTGDVVLRYTGDGYDHVILFNEFLNYAPQNGAPIPGETRFMVYEAALGPHKVVESEYLLTELVAEQQFFLNTNHNTDKVTIRRLRYCDPNSCKDDGVYELGDYYPRTYFTPIDVSLVIDRSGSMSWNRRMLRAQLAASMFVDFMRPGDKIGVVAFNNSASVIYPLHTIGYGNYPLPSEKMVAKNAINNLYASGGTSIGGGLQAGDQDLITNGVDISTGEADPVRIMILLSDGWETSPPFVTDDLLNNINGAGITVHTLGIDIYADQELLTNIASQTGGSYYYATADGIRSMFNYLMVKVYGEKVVRSVSGTVPSGATVEENVLVDSTMGSMTVSLLWPGSDLDLTLIQPDGSIITPDVAEIDPHITFTSGATYEFYKIQAPQPGAWTMRVFGKATSSTEEEYTIMTSTRDAMILSVDVDKSEYFAGDPIKLTASIEDSFSAAPTGPEYIYGATMLVTAEDPAPNQYAFELYDDGQHGDGGANDGVYANAFSNTSLAGSYNFNVHVSGLNNRDGQPFTREYILSQVVSERTFQDVVVDIKPGSDPNSVNCKNENEVVTVAVLTTDTFDALSIDATTVTFEGAGETHADKKTGEPQRHEEDVDKDGDIDLVFHFRLGDTNLACSATEGTLTGSTYDGLRIIGVDSIRMIDKKK